MEIEKKSFASEMCFSRDDIRRTEIRLKSFERMENGRVQIIFVPFLDGILVLNDCLQISSQ